MVDVEEKGSFLLNRPADVPVVLCRIVGRLRGQKRISRIEGGVIPQHKELPVILIRSRLGENLDSAIAQLVVLRRKWILVDTNFANGRFWRKLSRSKSVDVHLPA